MEKWFEGHPLAIKSFYDSIKANENILLEQGVYQIKWNTNLYEANCELFFRWFPTKGGLLVGKFASVFDFDFNGALDVEVFSDELKVGTGFIQTMSISGEFSLVLQKDCFLGSPSVPVDEITFNVPNSINFGSFGLVSDGKSNVYTARNSFSNNNFSFDLDTKRDFNDRLKSLKQTSGYQFLHVGRIKFKKKPINGFDFSKLRKTLNLFFSLLNGRRISIQIISGVHNGEVLWTDYHGYSMQSFRQCITWVPRNKEFNPEMLWNSLAKLVDDTDGETFIETALQWYTDANNNQGWLESSIVTAQMALELLYNWIVIEKGRIILGPDAEKLSAANKVRLLLSTISINADVPDDLNQLTEFIRKNQNLNDGVDVLIEIRNAVVHAQSAKRERWKTIKSGVIFEAWTLSMWYVELAILFSIGYEGEYINRTKRNESFEGNRTEMTPWASKSE
jgi:hypothetical protein